MYFNVHFNVFFKLIKVHLLVSELYMASHSLLHKLMEGLFIIRKMASVKHTFVK